MAKSIDIRKVELPDFWYYESVADTIPVTLTGRFKGITEFGHKLLQKRKPYCRLLRKLVRAVQAGNTPNKPLLSAKYRLAGRMFNTAFKQAQAIVGSAIESLKSTLEDLGIDINRQVVECFHSPSGELHGRVRKLKRLYKQQKKLLKQQGRPHIHFGRKAYQDQEAAGWKQAYEEARNDRIACIGSSDEAGGNSTFQIRVKHEDWKTHFEVYHARKLIGRFNLKPQQASELEAILAINHQPFTFTQEKAKQGPRKGQLVLRKVTTGRVPLTVTFIREENKHWYAKVAFIKDKVTPDYAPVGAIGVDLNCDSIADTWVQMADGAPLVQSHHKRLFDPSWTKERKVAWIYEQVNDIVLTAKENHLMVALEYLDFEGAKRWLRTKMGAMLRVMPYRQIRQVFERRCMEQGVVLRYVKSNHTSLLGAILTDYPNLGRDQAAAAVIGLRASEAGNAWLEKQSQKILVQERSRLRINRKRQFGCTVMIGKVWIDRQLQDHPEKAPALDRSADVHRFQTAAGRAINDLSKAMGALFQKNKRIPGCWERSGSEWKRCNRVQIPRHPVVPEVKRHCEKPKCSTLGN